MNSATSPTKKSRKSKTDNSRWNRLYNFSREIVENPIVVKEPHLEMCQFLDVGLNSLYKANTPNARQRKQLLLVPRGCGKTAIGVVALVLRAIASNPNIRILLDSAKQETAVERLSEIKGHIEGNDTFRSVYGDMRTDAEIWTTHAITIGTRTRKQKEKTVDTAGLDRSKNGGHYELIIVDDLVNELNCNSGPLLKKMRTHIQSLYPMLSPGGTLLIIGTRWAENDPYSWIIETDEIRRKQNKPEMFMKMIRSAYNGDGSLYAPTLLGHEQLEQHKDGMDPWLFNCNYMNQALPNDTACFPDQVIHRFFGKFVGGSVPCLEMEV